MNFKQCDDWFRSHTDVFLDLVRMYLGAGLLAKGVFFFLHPEQLTLPPGNESLMAVAQLVPYVHVAGGVLLLLGLLTRLAALIQLPFLFGAVFLVNLPRMVDWPTREGVEFSALVLFLLALISVKGAGRVSLDHMWRKARPSPAGPFEKWMEDHPDVFLDLVRMYLGVGLFMKGIYLMDHREQFMKLLEGSGAMSPMLVMAAHYVIPAHFAGGVALAFGVVTRFAAGFQVPALLGALVCVYLPRLASLEVRQGLEFSVLVLFLLMMLMFFGSGRISVDHALESGDEHQSQPRVAH